MKCAMHVDSLLCLLNPPFLVLFCKYLVEPHVHLFTCLHACVWGRTRGFVYISTRMRLREDTWFLLSEIWWQSIHFPVNFVRAWYLYKIEYCSALKSMKTPVAFLSRYFIKPHKWTPNKQRSPARSTNKNDRIWLVTQSWPELYHWYNSHQLKKAQSQLQPTHNPLCANEVSPCTNLPSCLHTLPGTKLCFWLHKESTAQVHFKALNSI